jgi:hypothetical protein
MRHIARMMWRGSSYRGRRSAAADAHDLAVLLAPPTTAPARRPPSRRHCVLALFVRIHRAAECTVHSHANLYWTAETYGRSVLGMRDVAMSCFPRQAFFAYGLGNA